MICSSYTCKSSENIYVAALTGGAQEKGKTGSKPDETQFGTKSGAFLSLKPPLKRLVYFFFFAGFFFESHPGFGPNSGALFS